MTRFDQEITKKIGEFWDDRFDDRRISQAFRLLKRLAAGRRLPVKGWFLSLVRSRGTNVGWWHNPFVVRSVNKRICGEAIDGRSQGLIRWLRDVYGPLFPLENGISVGCGDSSKELLFIKAGIVRRFDLYELSEKHIEKGRKLSRQENLEEHMIFHHGNAIEQVQESDVYDFVTWNDALHHMPDTDQALAWSRKVLRSGGIFALDDFIGASRFQWPNRQLETATAIRKAIDPKYRAIPQSPWTLLPVEVDRPSIQYMCETDPSEAADSDQILPAIRRHFPEATIRPTGGVVYHLALNPIMHNFHPRKDRALLGILMLLDDQCIVAGDTQYAAAIGQKP